MPGAPFFFRLGASHKAIAGYGFFAGHERVLVWLAWESFRDLNGTDTFAHADWVAGHADLRSSDDPNHRFLSLTGVVIGLAHVEPIVQPQMEGLKSAFFGSHPDVPVILHRKELVNRRGPFASLRDPAVNADFDGELLGLMRSRVYTVISVCLDKQAYRQKYTVWQYEKLI